MRRPDFSKVFILHTNYNAFGIGAILDNLMRKARNMLSPMHPEATTRPRATTLHLKRNVLLLYGPSYISGPIFMAPNSLCILTTNLSSG
jgi:hypothetical protein